MRLAIVILIVILLAFYTYNTGDTLPLIVGLVAIGAFIALPHVAQLVTGGVFITEAEYDQGDLLRNADPATIEGLDTIKGYVEVMIERTKQFETFLSNPSIPGQSQIAIKAQLPKELFQKVLLILQQTIANQRALQAPYTQNVYGMQAKIDEVRDKEIADIRNTIHPLVIQMHRGNFPNEFDGSTGATLRFKLDKMKTDVRIDASNIDNWYKLKETFVIDPRSPPKRGFFDRLFGRNDYADMPKGTIPYK